MQGWEAKCYEVKPAISESARKWRNLLLVAGLGLAFLVVQERSAQAIGFSATGNMGTERQFHTATLLNDGDILVTGGGLNGSGSTLNSAELYNPAARSFTAIPAPMHDARSSHTATRLGNGRVLIAGGTSDGSTGLNSAEIYDPATRTFTPTTGTMNARRLHTATLLADGKVLIAGGRSGNLSSSTLNTAEIFDPATGLFAATTGLMKQFRAYHTATLLNDGRVLITGGLAKSSVPQSSAEIFDPATGQFSLTTGPMNVARNYHAAVLLQDETVLITGGATGTGAFAPSLTSAEIFDPMNGTFALIPGPGMNNGHSKHAATLLPSGNVLIAGDSDSSLADFVGKAAEVFHPLGQVFLSADPMITARASYPALLLDDGTVLLAGGLTNGGSATAAAETFNPAAIAATPASYTFPVTAVNSTSAPRTFTISNTDVSPVVVSSVDKSGLDAAMFTIAPNNCGTLAANGGTCSVSVTFTPDSAGEKSASLDISSDDPEMPVLSIPLNGTGIPLTSTLSVSIGGTGAGSVNSTPSGIACSSGSGAGCQAQFNNGTQVTLTAVPNAGSAFIGWSGACGGTGDCVMPLNSNTSVTATFNIFVPPTSTLTVSIVGTGVAGTGAGSVNSIPSGIACVSGSGANCQAQFNNGTQVSLLPTANADSVFAGWSGACSGTGICAPTLNSNTSVTATFTYMEPARIANTALYFSSLQGAYDSALSGSGNEIQARAFTFTENPVFNGNIAVTIKGGYDMSYSNIIDYSMLHGVLTIGNGAVTLDRLIIR